MNCPVCGNTCVAPIALATETLKAPIKSLTYRLLLLASSEPVFSVEITEESGYCATAVVGADLTTALAVYLKLVKNGVRACHLEDIVRDIAYGF